MFYFVQGLCNPLLVHRFKPTKFQRIAGAKKAEKLKAKIQLEQFKFVNFKRRNFVKSLAWFWILLQTCY